MSRKRYISEIVYLILANLLRKNILRIWKVSIEILKQINYFLKDFVFVSEYLIYLNRYEIFNLF